MFKSFLTSIFIALLLFGNVLSQESGEVIITEIMYNPNSTETTERTQYIEIVNTTGTPVSLENWTIDDEDADGPNTLPNIILPAYGIGVICGSSEADFTGAFGSGYIVISMEDLGQTMFNLANSPSATNEIIYLRDASSNLVDSVNYDDANSWPGDPGGVSIYLALANDQMNAVSNNNGSNWANSQDGVDGAFTSVISGVWDAVETGSPGNINGDQALPVELTSFTAKAGDGQVHLNWTTASEIDNAGFAILRSMQKESDYEEIDSYKFNDALKGAGNASTAHSYYYIDRAVHNGITYWYKLADVDFNGLRKEHGPVCATPNAADVQIDPVESSIPVAFELAQNCPNPFNPSTHIHFDIPELNEGLIDVNLTVYDMLGKKVNTLLESPLTAGPYEIVWNGMNAMNQPAPSGIYICRLQSALFNAQIKMVLMR